MKMISRLFGLTLAATAALALAGVAFKRPAFDVILPVGISFYTFQALSYTMDVYRGEVEPERNLFRYALFVSFFPQLVAGPIERSKNLLSQLYERHDFDPDRARDGMLLMLWGMFALEEGKPQVSASLPEGDTRPLTTSAKARPPSLPSWQR